MTELHKPVTRQTNATEFERSQLRNIIVSIEPVRGNAVIGVRPKGTRQTYRIGIASIYQMAVRLHLQNIEKEAKKLAKEESVPMRTARARARKQLAKELK